MGKKHKKYFIARTGYQKYPCSYVIGLYISDIAGKGFGV